MKVKKHMKKISVIGLGSMGFGSGCCLVNAGFTTYGVDIRDEALVKFESAGGIATRDGHYAVKNSQIVFVYLVSANDIKTVILGENGYAKSAAAGTIFVLCTTMPAQDTIAIANELHNMGLRVLDAPVSGGQIKANSGDLTLMASGKPDVFRDAKPALDAISATVFDLSDKIGVGSKIKMINQLLAGSQIAVMGEAMALADRIGLDLSTVYDVISKSAGSSFVFANRGAFVRDADYTARSAVDIWLKDLNIVLDEAENVGFTPEMASLALSLFKQTAAQGMGRQDDSAIAKLIARKNGFKITGDNE